MSVISDFKSERQRRAAFEGPVYSVQTGTGLPGFDMSDVVAALWRGKWRVAGVLAAAIATCAAYLFAVATPRYAATAVVMLNTRQESVVDLESVMSGLSPDLATINTEIEVMRSRHLLGRVADDLGLERDPEFNPALRPDRLAGIRAAVTRYTGIALPARAEARDTRQRVIDALLESLSITAVRQSYVFRIAALTASAGKSARIANRVAEIYIVDQLDQKAAANDKAADWLRGQVESLTSRLEASEAAVESYLAATPLVSEQGLAALQARIKDLRARRREMAASAIAGPQASALDASIATLEQRRRAQAADLLKLRQLQREAEANLQIQKHFLSRLKEISVQQGIQHPDARVISGAEPPADPAEPNIAQSLVLAVAFGVLSGCALVLAAERFSQSFATSGDLEAETGLPVLGSVPLAPVRRREKLLGYVARHPSSGLAESVRNLRTSLLLRDAQNPPRVILTTSSVPGEGKSTLAMMLAQNAAAMGRNVLIVEADLRRQTFARFLAAPGGAGLAGVLRGSASLDEAVTRHPGAGFDVLCGGTALANPADLFSGAAYGDLVAELKRRYEFVVIDAPPVLPVTDARLLAGPVDAVIYAVRWKRTSKMQVQLGLGMLRSVGARIAGLALTQVNEARMARYQGYGGYGAYRAGKSYHAN